MDPKRGYKRHAQHSGSDSRSSSPASPASPAPAHSGGRPAGGNTFANDGSFMEMFKKKMEDERRRKEGQQREEEGCGSDRTSADDGQSSVPEKKPPAVTSFVGKRRGGAKLALKTGMVAKKQKVDELQEYQESGKSDAWSKYMAEVKKYKAHQCGDDDKTRPLVK